MKHSLIIIICLMILALSSCGESPKYWQPKQVIADFNNDSKNDMLNFVGVGNDGWGNPNYYQVSVSINSDGIFNKPVPVLRIPHNVDELEDIKCADANGDNKIDLVYIMDIGNDGFGHPNYYQIMVAYGNGDGTFASPEIIQKISR